MSFLSRALSGLGLAPGGGQGLSRTDVRKLKAGLDAGDVPVVVDVRTPAEFAEGHVPGALNLPLAEIGGRTGELSTYKEGPVHLICRSGARSARACRTLAREGFEVVNVDGGTMAWMAAGFPLEQ